MILSKPVGIDLGTTSSAVAVMDPTNTNIILHKDARTKGQTTPSCVWKDPRSGQIIVGRRALSRIGTMPVPIRAIKRSMGRQIKVLLTDEEMTPEQVSAYILAELRRQIEEDVARFNTDTTEWIVDRAIITVPAYFDQNQIDATRRAAELAGLQLLELLHEPVAAACYHCWRTSTQNGVFLGYNFGGGTFDVSVVRCTEGTFEVLGISGNMRLGGNDIDVVLAEALQGRLLRDDYALDLDVINDPEDKLRFDKLKLLAEQVKKGLSNSSEFLLSDTWSLEDKGGTRVLIDIVFERPEVEELMRSIVECTLPYCFEALAMAEQRAGMTLADVDAIILSGGSTHIPLVREMVQKIFCADPASQGPRAKCTEPVYENVDTNVALGAAIRAAVVGGLAIDNPERTVRVTLRGSGRKGYIAGEVQALAPGIDLTGGRIRLTLADPSFEGEQQLEADGTFVFREVMLQPSVENLLTFQVYGQSGALEATVGRSVSSSEEALRLGYILDRVLWKAIYLQVNHAGGSVRKELFPAFTALPSSVDLQCYHPGDTELISIPLYQGGRITHVILVMVPPILPRGTLITLNIRVDGAAYITARSRIGETISDCIVEVLPEWPLPIDEQF